MVWHAITFDGDECCVPPGVDPEVWRLELPSILGAAFGSAELDDDLPDIAYQTDDEEDTDTMEAPLTIHGTSQRLSIANDMASVDKVQDVMDLTNEDDIFSPVTPAFDYAATVIDPMEPEMSPDTDGDEQTSCHVERMHEPHITLEVPYSMPPEPLLEQWNLPMDHVWILETPILGDAIPPENPLELFAFRALCRGSMNLEMMQDMLQAIIQYLPQLVKARKRKCTDFSIAKDRHSFSLTWGSYVIGGSSGITRNTRSHPWMSKLLVALVRGQRRGHVFSSISLHLNTYMTPHLDKHNHPALPSLLVACGRWQGGGLWVSEMALPQQRSGDMMGRVYNVGSPSVLFRAHVLHSTMAWRGQRFIMVAYANNGIRALQEEEVNTLSNLGFDCRY